MLLGVMMFGGPGPFGINAINLLSGGLTQFFHGFRGLLRPPLVVFGLSHVVTLSCRKDTWSQDNAS